MTALKDAPARLTDASAKATEAAGKVAATVAGAAETVQSKIALGQLDPRALREKFAEPDLRAVREKTQNLALAQVGRALGIAGKAVETYDGYAERGKVIVDRVLGGLGGTDVEVVTVETVAADQRETVVVDEVEVVAQPAPKAEAKTEPKTETKTAAKPEPELKAETPVAAPKKPATPRRNTTPRKKANDTAK